MSPIDTQNYLMSKSITFLRYRSFLEASCLSLLNLLIVWDLTNEVLEFFFFNNIWCLLYTSYVLGVYPQFEGAF